MSRAIWCENWMWPFFYGFCPDEAAWKREMKMLGSADPYPDNPAGAKCNEFVPKDPMFNNRILVTVGHRKDRTPLQVVTMLQHEAVHVFQKLCAVIGEHDPSIEFEAYMIEAISKELIIAYEKTRGKLFRGR